MKTLTITLILLNLIFIIGCSDMDSSSYYMQEKCKSDCKMTGWEYGDALGSWGCNCYNSTCTNTIIDDKNNTKVYDCD
jgi:hypothetical protein